MDARAARFAALFAALLALGASHRTENFIVSAATKSLAQEVAEAAETFRRDLAIEWLGRELPRWDEPCPIEVLADPGLPAGGETSFVFSRGRPCSWKMFVQGSRELVLDSVLPHEVTHTIFATHFRQPLPRWADEGACTTVEGAGERRKQDKLLIKFLTTDRGIAFNTMFAMKEYPSDIIPLYSQGYSLARFLIGHGGKRKFVEYIGDGLERDNWTAATRKHYGYENLGDLQTTWLDWVRRGSPALEHAEEASLAAATSAAPADQPTAAEFVASVASHQEQAGAAADEETLVELASSESGESWYARQRDEVYSQRRQGHGTDF
jgi:hypothetical protein